MRYVAVEGFESAVVVPKVQKLLGQNTACMHCNIELLHIICSNANECFTISAINHFALCPPGRNFHCRCSRRSAALVTQRYSTFTALPHFAAALTAVCCAAMSHSRAVITFSADRQFAAPAIRRAGVIRRSVARAGGAMQAAPCSRICSEGTCN